jgi:Stage II sporulation protein E (SpoIIE)
VRTHTRVLVVACASLLALAALPSGATALLLTETASSVSSGLPVPSTPSAPSVTLPSPPQAPTPSTPSLPVSVPPTPSLPTPSVPSTPVSELSPPADPTPSQAETGTGSHESSASGESSGAGSRASGAPASSNGRGSGSAPGAGARGTGRGAASSAGRSDAGATSDGRRGAVAAPLVAGVSGAASTRAARGTYGATGSNGQPSPVVRTIEHIVGVVPLAVWIALGSLALLSLLLLAGSWLYAARARRIERQRRVLVDDVSALQAALLPTVPERIGTVRTSVAYHPADGPAAGGDFYDVFTRRDGRLALIIGDISGHGRSALRETALVRYTLRAYLDAGMRPRIALRTGATVLDDHLAGALVTAAVALYDPGERVLTYSCAGHAPPLVIGSRPLEPVLECSSPPIGTGSTTGLRETSVLVPGRARVCFFTDGVVEARVDGELFGLERLANVLGELGEETSAQALLARVAALSDRSLDDMSACLLDMAGPPLHPSVRSEELELDGADLAAERARRFLLAHGVGTPCLEEALEHAAAMVAREGTAVMRLRLEEPSPEVDITPPRLVGGSDRIDISALVPRISSGREAEAPPHIKLP